MTRSKFLVAGFALSVLLCLPPASSAVAQTAQVDGPTVRWNMSVWGQRRAQSEGSEALIDLVSKATGGKFQIRIHYGEALSPAAENIDGLKIGAFQMAHIVPAFHPAKIPAFTVFDLPFLPISDLKTQARVALKYYQHPAVLADLARWDAVPLMPVLLPSYEMQGRGRAPERLQDLSGMRVRAPGGLGEALRTVGAVPTSVSSSEIYSAMERGMYDSIVQSHYSAIAFKTHEISQWYTTKLDLGILGVVLAVNKPAWERLPPQYRKVLEDSIGPALTTQIGAYDKAQGDAVAAMKARGMREVNLSTDDR
jgi:TRAP-type C4-dicarboxylate transport system substrate-binding protein